MSNIYVPIDYTNVSEVVPEGDDILYSTLCKVFKQQLGGAFGSKTVKFQSHILLTQSGFAMSIPQKKKKIALTFMKWTEIRKMRPTATEKLLLKWGISGYKQFRFQVIRVPDHESLEIFSERKRKFIDFCKDLWSKNVKEQGDI